MASRREKITDEFLVLASRAGDRRAFEQLVARYQKPLWRFAYRLTGSEDGAWEVLQESWMAVTRGLGKLRDAAHFRRWIFGIVRLRASDFHRTLSKQPQDNQIETIGIGPTNTIEANDDHEAIKLILASLGSHHRSVLMLHYLEDFEIWEIAKILGIPEGTVKSRLHHARSALKQILERSKA